MALAKVQITVEHTGEKFKVLFNPEEYTLNKDNNFASQTVPGLSGPLLQFVNGNLRTLEMELFFDTYDTPQLPKRDVREETKKIVGEHLEQDKPILLALIKARSLFAKLEIDRTPIKPKEHARGAGVSVISGVPPRPTGCSTRGPRN